MIFAADPNITDVLKSDVVISRSDTLACFSFPISCTMPPTLATARGDLVLGASGAPFRAAGTGRFAAVLASEPATLGLLAFGGAALGLMRRKSLSSPRPCYSSPRRGGCLDEAVRLISRGALDLTPIATHHITAS